MPYTEVNGEIIEVNFAVLDAQVSRVFQPLLSVCSLLLVVWCAFSSLYAGMVYVNVLTVCSCWFTTPPRSGLSDYSTARPSAWESISEAVKPSNLAQMGPHWMPWL